MRRVAGFPHVERGPAFAEFSRMLFFPMQLSAILSSNLRFHQMKQNSNDFGKAVDVITARVDPES